MSQEEALSPAARTVRLHRATGVSVLSARQIILEQPELAGRILRAAESQTTRSRLQDPIQDHLHDPLEDDPAYASIVAEAFAQAERDIDVKLQTDYFRGRCHAVWQRVEFLLREKHGLTWYSPARMNPGSIFD